MRYETHVYGDEPERTLVLLHPGGALHAIWLPMIKQWSDKYKIIAFDLYPPSPREPYSLNLMAQHLLETLQKMEIQEFDLVGASLGANIALHMAIQVPNRVHTLVVDSGQVGSPKPPITISIVLTVIETIIRLLPASVVINFLMKQYKHLNDEESQTVRKDVEQLGKFVFVQHAKANLDHYVGDQLHQITCPTLILAGANDMLTKTNQHQKLLSSIDGANLIVVPDAGHVTFLSQPTPFVSAVEEFWDNNQNHMQNSLEG